MKAATAEDWKLIELTDEEHKWSFEIPFVGMHKNYGRAEFQYCAQWKRGKVADLWIYPRQQERREYWHLKLGYSEGIAFSNYHEDGGIWRTTWCKDHKCPSLHLYVPRNTSVMTIQVLSTLSVDFKR